MPVFCDCLDVLIGDHTPIAHEDEPAEVEALAQVNNDFLYCRMVDAVACPDVMGDRPTGDHDHANDHLHVLRLAIAAVAVCGEVVWTDTLEGRTGDVVEHQVGLQTEETAEAMIERDFDRILGRMELVESAIPSVDLPAI